MTKRPSYRRRRYLVRKGFQLRYVGLILAVALLSALISGYTVYHNSWILLGDKLANVYPQGELVSIFRSVNVKLAINLIFISILCVGLGIIASHRIAGPVYRMKVFLTGVISGDYTKRLKLRKSDELTDLADVINRLVDKLESEK